MTSTCGYSLMKTYLMVLMFQNGLCISSFTSILEGRFVTYHLNADIVFEITDLDPETNLLINALI